MSGRSSLHPLPAAPVVRAGAARAEAQVWDAFGPLQLAVSPLLGAGFTLADQNAFGVGIACRMPRRVVIR